MQHEDLEQGLEAARKRLKELSRLAGGLSAPDSLLLDEALEQLAIDVEELRVTRDELLQQNEQLAAARRTIERERQRYRELFDLAPDAYLVTTYAAVIQEANRAAAALLGRGPEALHGKPLHLFMGRGLGANLRQLLWQLRRKESVWGWETVMQRSDGHVFHAAVDVTGEECEGRLVGFRWILRDISERKRAEALLADTREGLEHQVRKLTTRVLAANESLQREVTVRRLAQAEQQRYVRLVENSSDFIGMAEVSGDMAGRLLFLNPAGRRVAGLDSAEQVPAAHLADLWTEETRARVQAALPVVREMGRWRGDGQIRCRKTGRVADVDINLLLVEGEGVSPCLCLVLHDITERKRIERIKAEFVSTVSHELRTPLTSITGSLGLMAGGVTGELPLQARGMLEIAYRNSERLVRLINELLDMDRIESGHMALDLKPIELEPLIQQTLDSNRPYALPFGVSFALEVQAPGPRVRADPHRLTQVLTNLLSNAAKFSPPGETVQVSAARADGMIRIAVTDHGPGIPQEFRPQLFEKFARADATDSRQRGGTGLGLSIAKALVEGMGGRITVDSEVGRGSTFCIELPECAAEDAGGGDNGEPQVTPGSAML